MSDTPFLPAVSGLFDELGVNALPAEKQQALKEKIATIVVQSVLLRCIEAFSDLQKRELDEVLSASPNDADVLYDFLKQNVPDFDDIVRDEVAKFRDEAAGFLKATAT